MASSSKLLEAVLNVRVSLLVMMCKLDFGARAPSAAPPPPGPGRDEERLLLAAERTHDLAASQRKVILEPQSLWQRILRCYEMLMPGAGAQRGLNVLTSRVRLLVDAENEAKVALEAIAPRRPAPSAAAPTPDPPPTAAAESAPVPAAECPAAEAEQQEMEAAESALDGDGSGIMYPSADDVGEAAIPPASGATFPLAPVAQPPEPDAGTAAMLMLQSLSDTAQAQAELGGGGTFGGGGAAGGGGGGLDFSTPSGFKADVIDDALDEEEKEDKEVEERWEVQGQKRGGRKGGGGKKGGGQSGAGGTPKADGGAGGGNRGKWDRRR